jgi:hypothetical protein
MAKKFLIRPDPGPQHFSLTGGYLELDEQEDTWNWMTELSESRTVKS